MRISLFDEAIDFKNQLTVVVVVARYHDKLKTMLSSKK